MRIIPAIDLLEGKCVRLNQGNYLSRKIYNENPLDVAKMFEDAGLKHLHLVDLDGAKAKKIINYKILNQISTFTSLKIDFGGGLRSDSDLNIAFENGAAQVTGGSVAITDSGLFKNWIKKYGNEKIMLGADVKQEKVFINGWSLKTDSCIFKFVEDYLIDNIKYIVCTDIMKDGMLTGPSIELYKKLKLKFPSLSLIASGGVSKIEDLDLLLENNLEGAIIGKAIYEGLITLKQIENFLTKNAS